MTVEFGVLLKDGCSSVYNAYGKWFESSILTALIITLIIIVIIMFMYPAKSNACFMSILKMFAYMYLSIFIVLFLHDGIIEKKKEESKIYNLDDIEVNLNKETSKIDIRPEIGELTNAVPGRFENKFI